MGEKIILSAEKSLSTFSAKSEMKMLLSHDKFREPFFQGSFVDSSKWKNCLKKSNLFRA